MFMNDSHILFMIRRKIIKKLKSGIYVEIEE